MNSPARRSPATKTRRTSFDIEALIGSILQVGVLSSVILIVAGLAWHWLAAGNLRLDYVITGTDFFGFVETDLHQLFSGPFRPRLLINLGIAVLMLTPYLRVLASLAYFAFVDHNRKYVAITGFVFGVLTYSLLLR